MNIEKKIELILNYWDRNNEQQARAYQVGIEYIKQNCSTKDLEFYVDRAYNYTFNITK